jgi:hypothetical protein
MEFLHTTYKPGMKSLYKTAACYRYHNGRIIRLKSLDRICEEEVLLSLAIKNPKFKNRKGSVVPTFRYYLEKGYSREDAYYEACRTQLIGIKPRKLTINIDSRTVWEMADPE